jgi:hypothetical protein
MSTWLFMDFSTTVASNFLSPTHRIQSIRIMSLLMPSCVWKLDSNYCIHYIGRSTPGLRPLSIHHHILISYLQGLRPFLSIQHNVNIIRHLVLHGHDVVTCFKLSRYHYHRTVDAFLEPTPVTRALRTPLLSAKIF